MAAQRQILHMSSSSSSSDTAPEWIAVRESTTCGGGVSSEAEEVAVAMGLELGFSLDRREEKRREACCVRWLAHKRELIHQSREREREKKPETPKRESIFYLRSVTHNTTQVQRYTIRSDR